MIDNVTTCMHEEHTMSRVNFYYSCFLTQTLANMFFSLRRESNPQPSDLRGDGLTIELPGLRWQREGYDVYWFLRATYVLLSQRVSICLYILKDIYIKCDFFCNSS